MVRRRYNNNKYIEKPAPVIDIYNPNNKPKNFEELNKAIVETLELLSNNVTELKSAINLINNRLNSIESRTREVHNENLNKQNESMNRTFTKIPEHPDIDTIPINTEPYKMPKESDLIDRNKPLLPGKCFESLTYDSLKDLIK